MADYPCHNDRHPGLDPGSIRKRTLARMDSGSPLRSARNDEVVGGAVCTSHYLVLDNRHPGPNHRHPGLDPGSTWNDRR